MPTFLNDEAKAPIGDAPSKMIDTGINGNGANDMAGLNSNGQSASIKSDSGLPSATRSLNGAVPIKAPQSNEAKTPFPVKSEDFSSEAAAINLPTIELSDTKSPLNGNTSQPSDILSAKEPQHDETLYSQAQKSTATNNITEEARSTNKSEDKSTAKKTDSFSTLNLPNQCLTATKQEMQVMNTSQTSAVPLKVADTRKLLKCPKCPSTFYSKSGYYRHIKKCGEVKVSGRKNIEKFHVPQISQPAAQMFTRPVLHPSVIQEDKATSRITYKCPQCPSDFYSKSGFYKHVKRCKAKKLN